MTWDIPSASLFSLKVTGGTPCQGKDLSPKVGECINAGYPYGYVLFDKLTVDVYSGPDGKGENLKSITIEVVVNNGNKYPYDASGILIMDYSKEKSIYKPNWWECRNYFSVTAPSLHVLPRLPIITNEWYSGQGNTNSKPVVGESFWVIDYGDDPGRWTAENGSIYQSTAGSSGNFSSRAFPVKIAGNNPDWTFSGGVGVAKEGVWQIDIKIGSNGNLPFCETFYLAERFDFHWGPEYYSDGQGGGEGEKKVHTGFSREIDIMETGWKPSGPQINLPGDGGTKEHPQPVTSWNPFDPNFKSVSLKPWTDVGGAPTDGFITFGCLIRDDELWLYAYLWDGQQWYCTPAIKRAGPYIQGSPFVPYIGTWCDKNNKTSEGWKTGYHNFIYLPPDDPKIAGKNPRDNPEAFGLPLSAGWQLIPGKMSTVSVAADGTVWGVNSEGNVCRYVGGSAGWERGPGEPPYPTGVKAVAVGSATNLWILGDHSISTYDFDSREWVTLSGDFDFSCISAAADGTVLGVSNVSSESGNVYKYRADAQWDVLPGNLNLTVVAAGSSANIWGVDNAGKIYKYNGQGWDSVAGSLSTISVANDGTVWGTDSEENVYRLDGGTNWKVVPFTRFGAVAVGSAKSVWGVNSIGAIYRYVV